MTLNCIFNMKINALCGFTCLFIFKLSFKLSDYFWQFESPVYCMCNWCLFMPGLALISLPCVRDVSCIITTLFRCLTVISAVCYITTVRGVTVITVLNTSKNDITPDLFFGVPIIRGTYKSLV